MAALPFNLPELTPTSPHFSRPFLPMKDLSLFLLKTSLTSKMKRGIRSFCNSVGSTSTLNQSKADADVSCVVAPSVPGSYMEDGNHNGSPRTLEEMLLQLDLEEAAARRANLDEYGAREINRRMSCVNSSDILRSARNALNQYPRFSLDGKDAMYRSSFRNLAPGRSSCKNDGYELDVERSLRMPPTVAGECVVWCKPSIVAKLMGLDVVPVPVPATGSRGHGRRKAYPAASRSRNLRRMGRYELEKDRIAMSMSGCRESVRARESSGSSSAGTGYCVVKPVKSTGEEWRFRRAR